MHAYTPDMVAMELLDCIAEDDEVSKWMIIKVLGNTTQFRRWIEEFMIPEGLLKKE